MQLSGGNPYQLSAINLYTNYDGKGGNFGNNLVPTNTDDVSLASSYAAINDNDKSEVTVMLTNKDMEKSENAVISLDNSDKTYEAAAVYAIYGDSSEIRLLDIVKNVNDNKVEVTLPALATAMIVVSDDASDFKDLKPYDPDSIEKKVVTIDNPSANINNNGFVEIPIEDPEHLKEIKLTANVTSSAGSSWGTAGCTVSINAKDKNGTDFWTSKSYTLGLGSGQTATIEFDGTFKNDEEDVEAVIADGKVELQQWWEASEKQEEGITDTISVEYVKAEVVYEYKKETPSSVRGDVNADGTFSMADIIMLQKWLIGAGDITDIKAGDLYEDGKINIFDLSIMKQELIEK